MSIIISVVVGFLVYFVCAQRALKGMQIREGGGSVVFLMFPALVGAASGFVFWYVIEFFA